jgi:hypothetical protein
VIELQNVNQSRTNQLASARTAADGSFTTAVTLAHNANLRALHPQAPVSASEILAVGIAPAVELKLQSSSPLRVTDQTWVDTDLCTFRSTPKASDGNNIRPRSVVKGT